MHTVATGGCYLTPDIAIKLASGRQDPLTKRERQVAEKLAQGMAVKEIAAEPLVTENGTRPSRQSDGKTGRQ